MSQNYTQLSLVQRYQIQAFLSTEMKQKTIAQKIGVHPSTISRELSRNTAKRGRSAGAYKAEKAQQKTDFRHDQKPKRVTFTTSMKEQAAKWLTQDKWSPEIISVKGHETGLCPVSPECLYQWIWYCKRSHKRADKPYKFLYQHLRHARRRRKRGNRKDKRGRIQHRVSIEKRPKIVEKRRRLGDMEVDFMMGKNHKGAVLVVTDRATLHTRLHILKGRNSKVVSKRIIRKYCTARQITPYTPLRLIMTKDLLII